MNNNFIQHYRLAKVYKELAISTNELHYLIKSRKHFKLALFYKQELDKGVA